MRGIVTSARAEGSSAPDWQPDGSPSPYERKMAAQRARREKWRVFLIRKAFYLGSVIVLLALTAVFALPARSSVHERFVMPEGMASPFALEMVSIPEISVALKAPSGWALDWLDSGTVRFTEPAESVVSRIASEAGNAGVLLVRNIDMGRSATALDTGAALDTFIRARGGNGENISIGKLSERRAGGINGTFATYTLTGSMLDRQGSCIAVAAGSRVVVLLVEADTLSASIYEAGVFQAACDSLAMEQ